MKELEKANNYYGLKSFRFLEGQSVYLSVEELKHVEPEGIAPICLRGSASVVIQGLNGIEEFSSYGSFGELDVTVDLDIPRMLISCRIMKGDVVFSLDPSGVSYTYAAYKQGSFCEYLKKSFYNECAVARCGLLADRRLVRFEYDPSQLPERTSEYRFEKAVADAFARLCPKGKVYCQNGDKWIGFREEERYARSNPYKEYLFHRELQLVAPKMKISCWLPETSDHECQAMLGIVDQTIS